MSNWFGAPVGVTATWPSGLVPCRVTLPAASNSMPPMFGRLFSAFWIASASVVGSPVYRIDCAVVAAPAAGETKVSTTWVLLKTGLVKVICCTLASDAAPRAWLLAAVSTPPGIAAPPVKNSSMPSGSAPGPDVAAPLVPT